MLRDSSGLPRWNSGGGDRATLRGALNAKRGVSERHLFRLPTNSWNATRRANTPVNQKDFIRSKGGPLGEAGGTAAHRIYEKDDSATFSRIPTFRSSLASKSPTPTREAPHAMYTALFPEESAPPRSDASSLSLPVHRDSTSRRESAPRTVMADADRSRSSTSKSKSIRDETSPQPSRNFCAESARMIAQLRVKVSELEKENRRLQDEQPKHRSACVDAASPDRHISSSENRPHTLHRVPSATRVSRSVSSTVRTPPATPLNPRLQRSPPPAAYTRTATDRDDLNTVLQECLAEERRRNEFLTKRLRRLQTAFDTLVLQPSLSPAAWRAVVEHASHFPVSAVLEGDGASWEDSSSSSSSSGSGDASREDCRPFHHTRSAAEAATQKHLSAGPHDAEKDEKERSPEAKAPEGAEAAVRSGIVFSKRDGKGSPAGSDAAVSGDGQAGLSPSTAPLSRPREHVAVEEVGNSPLVSRAIGGGVRQFFQYYDPFRSHPVHSSPSADLVVSGVATPVALRMPSPTSSSPWIEQKMLKTSTSPSTTTHHYNAVPPGTHRRVHSECTPRSVSSLPAPHDSSTVELLLKEAAGSLPTSVHDPTQPHREQSDLGDFIRSRLLALRSSARATEDAVDARLRVVGTDLRASPKFIADSHSDSSLSPSQ